MLDLVYPDKNDNRDVSIKITNRNRVLIERLSENMAGELCSPRLLRAVNIHRARKKDQLKQLEWIRFQIQSVLEKVRNLAREEQQKFMEKFPKFHLN
ncbi:hypothetical protein MK079_04990 [Candidatus Gracilibacteria bacterium]|nr:hypothetical protein [Candidatus Gracilibacteria bacterium]